MGIHDAIFKRSFGLPENAAGELRAVLPASLVAKIDLAALELVPGSFVDAALADRHTDLLFRTTLRSGKPALVHFLIEHQSEPHPLMPLRLLVYMVRIWEAYARETEEQRLPIILPIVVHHGDQGWTAPTRLRELIAGFDELGDDADRIPDFRFTIDDLAHTTNAEIMARPLAPFAQVALWVLRDARNERRLVANLRAWVGPLARLADEAHDEHLHAVMSYLFGVASRDAFDDIAAALKAVPRTESSMTTIAEWLTQQGFEKGVEQGIERGIEQGIEQGLEQGRARGLLEGKREMLRTAFEAKLGPLTARMHQQIEAATAPELDQLLQRILLATSIDDVTG